MSCPSQPCLHGSRAWTASETHDTALCLRDGHSDVHTNDQCDCCWRCCSLVSRRRRLWGGADLYLGVAHDTHCIQTKAVFTHLHAENPSQVHPNTLYHLHRTVAGDRGRRRLTSSQAAENMLKYTAAWQLRFGCRGRTRLRARTATAVKNVSASGLKPKLCEKFRRPRCSALV